MKISKLRKLFEELNGHKEVMTKERNGEYQIFEVEMKWQGFLQAHSIFREWDKELNIIHNHITDWYNIPSMENKVCNMLDEIKESIKEYKV